MFAFAIWDNQKKELILARDRYGIKPLYYYKGNNTFLFASEIKSFLGSGVYKPNINKKGLLEYFTFQNFFSSSTLFDNVQLIPAGSFMILGARDKEFKLQQFWDYNFSEPNKCLNQNQYEEKFLYLF